MKLGGSALRRLLSGSDNGAGWRGSLSRREALCERLPAAASLGLALFLLLPLTVYSSNLASVAVPKVVLTQSGLVLCLLMTAVLWALSCIPKIGGAVSAASQVTALAILALTIFPNRTGELSGFGSFMQSAPDLLPVAKLAIVLGVGGLLAWFRPRDMVTLNWFVLVAATTIVGYVAMFRVSAVDSYQQYRDLATTYFTELGEQENIIVVVMDAFTGYRMVELVALHPEIAEKFTGFSHYPHAIASALNTHAGLSALLTGDLKVALTDGGWSQRNAMALEHSFLVDARASGYDTAYLSFLTPDTSSIPSFSEQSFIPEQETSGAETLNRYLGFWSLSSSRILPSTAFRAVEAATTWAARPLADRSGENDWRTYQSLSNAAERAQFASKMSFHHLVDNLWVGSQPKRALFFHSKLTHGPYKLSDTGKFQRDVDPLETSVYGVRALATLLDRLRSLDRYESSLIFLVADHGGSPIEDSTMGGLFEAPPTLDRAFNPLIMVKPPHSREPFQTRSMTVWLGDVATTIRDHLGTAVPPDALFATRSLLAPEDPNRQIDVPLFFKSDQAGYHSTLQKWIQVNASGRFEDYAAFSVSVPKDLLSRVARIRLFAGGDPLLTRSVAEGWQVGEGPQFRAIIEINGLPALKLSKAGLIVLSNSSGEFKKDVLDEPSKAVAFMQGLRPDAVVFAVGLQLEPDVVRELFDTAPKELANQDAVSFAYATGVPGGPRLVFQPGTEDVSLDIDWP